MLNRKVTLKITRVMAALAAAAAILQLAFHPQSPWLHTNSAFFRTEAAIGHLSGFLYARKMPREFPSGSKMCWAWRWITAGVAYFVLYQSVDACIHIFPSLGNPVTFFIFDTGVSVSLFLMVVGLFGMWRAFRAAGLTYPFAAIDWIVVGLISIIITARCIHGDGTSPSAFAPTVWRIRIMMPALIGLGIVVLFLIYRASVAFGQGRLSKALRGILLFFGIHILFLQFDWAPFIWKIPVVDAATDATYYVLPWLLALALANFWTIPVSAARIAVKYESAESLSDLELEPVVE